MVLNYLGMKVSCVLLIIFIRTVLVNLDLSTSISRENVKKDYILLKQLKF